MKRISFKGIVIKILMLSIIVFFSYTFISKAININPFLLNIAKTGVFPMQMVDVIAYLALLAELSCIVLLVFKERSGIIASLLMMSAFTCYITLLYLLNRYEICGCGGILNGLPFHFHLLTNISIIVILTILLFTRKERIEK